MAIGLIAPTVGAQVLALLAPRARSLLRQEAIARAAARNNPAPRASARTFVPRTSGASPVPHARIIHPSHLSSNNFR